MNAITKALSEVAHSMPLEILQLGFRENSATINSNISLDEMIMSKVIRPRVLMDCNITGGIQTTINLYDCEITYGDNGEAIVKVPKSVTNNKSIVSALSIMSNITQNVAGAVNASGNSTLNAAVAISNGLEDMNVLQTANLELISDNLVLVHEYGSQYSNGVMRCMIENESNLSNISPRSYHSLAKLVILAVKAYVYNTLVVRLDKGYLYNGHELGIIKDIIDSYSDSNELYLEYLETKWKKIAFMNDTTTQNRFIKSMLGAIV